MDQKLTPLYTKLIEHFEKQQSSFHVPGHKFGEVFPDYARKHFSEVLSLDATEVSGLDDLHDPSEKIKEAQELLANFYDTIKSYFLVGGSTAGNLAAIFTVLERGDEVFVQRNSHKSIFHGLELVGAKPILISPMYDDVAKISSAIEISSVNAALTEYPNVKAAIFTNPNYYGMSVDLTPIINLLHKHNIPVIVDEAHGAHFCLGTPFPNSAIKNGADLIIQSAHKMLPAMTMGAYLHINSHRVSQLRLEHYLQVFQSSSPSYPVMASLDLARAFLASLSRDEVKQIVQSIDDFGKRVDAIPQLKRVNYSTQKGVRFDPLKVIIQSNVPYTGFELQKRLESKGIYTELADPYNVLFIFGLAPFKNTHGVLEILKSSVQDNQALTYPKINTYRHDGVYDITTLSLTFEEMRKLDSQLVSLSSAEGLISAQAVIPYPPGIPILMKGERITGLRINQIRQLHEQGARFQLGEDILTEGIRTYNITK